jgi:hypothetical protein
MWNRSQYRAILSIVVLTAFFGLVAPACADEPAADRSAEASGAGGGQPRIEFSSLEHDFGQALSGEDLTTKFTFKNVGDGVLRIENVKGG